MRLDKIKLVGFKSFVDPTTIHFPSNLLGIIGPNGCGKSNVIDAVRWVMGESSAKHLRGDSMADVIFNGSTGRKPVGQASIELVFDNSAGKLGGQYAQYSEISIRRLVSRDGQSHYFLNGARCRRKDITDIFLGTGLGPRSYAIIEQGMISRLIEAKPQDLRIFIEEAAGISKYKERRRETESRIRNTRDNIDRINDLRDELEKRLTTLQRQARAAERFKELKQEERLTKAQLQALRWQALNLESAEQEKRIVREETALEAQMAELRKVEAGMESQRDRQVEANDHFNQIQGEYYAVGAEIARLEQAIQHAKETRQQHERELGETEEAWSEAQRHIENDQQKIDSIETSLAEDEQQLSDVREREQVSSAALAESEQEMHAWQQRWDEFNHRAAGQVRTAEVERARTEHLEQHAEQLRARQTQLLEELETYSPHTLEAEIESLTDDLDRYTRRTEELEQRLEEKHGQIASNKNEINILGERFRTEQEALQRARERYASLDALQEEALGKSSETVNAWLHANGLGDVARLAEKISVESGWERAVEAVLGFHLEALCVDDLNQLSSQLSDLTEGRIAVFDHSVATADRESNPLGTPLLEKVRSTWSLVSLLRGIYTAGSLDEALALRSQLDAAESVITQSGIWVGSNWLRVERGVSVEGGVLAREQLLKELAGNIEQSTAAIAHIDEQIAETRGTIQEREDERDQLQEQRSDIARRSAEINAQLSGKQARLENVRNRQTRINAEVDEHRAQMDKDNTEIKRSRTRLHEALTATEGHDIERDELIKQRDTYRLRLEETRNQARDDRDAFHKIELRCQSMRTQLSATQENLNRTEHQRAHLGRRREELYQALSGGEEPISVMGTELEQQLANRLDVESTLADARREVESLDHSVRELNGQRHAVEQHVQNIRAELDKHRLACQEIKVRSQTVLEQIAEASFHVDALLADMPPEATEGQWHENLERIGRSIQRLGAINLAAIDEYAEQQERKQYLDAQYDDLSDALNTLETAIQKIDKETRNRFKDTYDKVNTGLQEKFPRLFGGGHAYLDLTGDDLLETGVTVMARPPGKRNSTIHLLSGGEKALTAVAMVFAIFELNPSPFCMLDEVDAPLDDANVGRFCDLVKSMSEHVQFIFITHNKITMEIAHQLTGVTMNEPGVSRLVAVDIDEAVELAVAS